MAKPLRRPTTTRPTTAPLFDGIDAPPWQEHWWDMPEFAMGDARPAYRITVNFLNREQVRAFAAALGISITPATDSIWYPSDDVCRPNEWEYADDDT